MSSAADDEPPMTAARRAALLDTDAPGGLLADMTRPHQSRGSAAYRRVLARVAVLDSERRQLSGVGGSLRQVGVADGDQVQQTLDVVVLGKLDLVERPAPP